jgi:serine/threonine protein kinase
MGTGTEGPGLGAGMGPPSAGYSPTTVPVSPASGPSLEGPTSGPVSMPRSIPLRFPEVGDELSSPRGTYRVGSVLGQGEFGAVYECSGPFDQVYAVKMMRPSNRPYAEVEAEWAKEVQRLLSLRHPNVVYIHDAFEQGHLFFLALERCDHPLSAMLGPSLHESLVVELGRQILFAVQFLHDHDVVHDDIHAGNVLVTHATDRPVLKLADFGISHELRGLPSVRANVVHHAIMAPEIVSRGHASRQSDIYQVGLLLYWMLTGTSAIDMSAPYEGLVQQVSSGEPRRKAEALGTPLGEVIAKMVRRREAYRYANARDVWAALRELPAWRERALFPPK